MLLYNDAHLFAHHTTKAPQKKKKKEKGLEKNQQKSNELSSDCKFRSYDLDVMSVARFLCAKSLRCIRGMVEGAL